MDAYIGEIRMFTGNYAPQDWQFCDGQILSITAYTELFSLLGTTYGGDGRSTFALPDLRGRLPIHAAADVGQKVGAESVALATANLPAHTHAVRVVSGTATATDPTGKLLANAVTPPLMYSLASAAAATPLSGGAVSANAGGQAHANMMPSLCVNFIICCAGGIFPERA